MPTLNFALSSEMKRWIKQQAETARYGSVSQYLRALVQRDLDERAFAQDVICVIDTAFTDGSLTAESAQELMTFARQQCQARAWHTVASMILQAEITRLRGVPNTPERAER